MPVNGPWKMPPLIKVYEALGAIGDGRVMIVDEREATVASSDGRKHYEVVSEGRTISANDNASYWQGYLGYPAIAVLLARGVLTCNHETTMALRGIPWKELNRRSHNDYVRALAEVATTLETRGADPELVRGECMALLEALRTLAPLMGPRRRPAPSH
ncbi:MAG TPA: hypothetical protein VKS22_15385 [Candidatus Binataceae bacterium]|nr:hypothetical protein [Candidatus Binataceae bacterium]